MTLATLNNKSSTSKNCNDYISYIGSVEELKELAMRLTRFFTSGGKNRKCFNSGVAAFVYNIMYDALEKLGTVELPERVCLKNSSSETICYALDSLVEFFVYLPDTLEVWPWDEYLQRWYGDKLATRLCPGVGNISILLKEDSELDVDY